MDIGKYEVFLKAVESGSLTKTAESLGYTQPGISIMIKKLEEECGFALFHRMKNGVETTDEGKIMIPIIRELVNWHQQFYQTAAMLNGLQIGTIKIASYSSMSYHWLPKIISNFSRDLSKIEIEVIEGGVTEIEKWLSEKSIDIAFLTKRKGQNFDTVPLKEDRVLAVLPPSRKNDAVKAFPLAAFKDERFIVSASYYDNDCYSVVEEFQRLYGEMPNKKVSATDPYTVISMVENGLGISVLPELLLKRHSQNIVAVPVDPPFTRTIILAAPSFDTCSPAAAKFMSYIKDFCKNEAD